VTDFDQFVRLTQEPPRKYPYGVKPEAAWHEWRLASCVEWNGGHDWHLVLDGGGVSLGCAHCPADSDDIFADASECLTLDLPVTYEIESQRYGGYDGPAEYDLWVHLTPRT
jgi:hypothetical protein